MNTDRWKNYGLWIAVASFIPLLLSSFGIQIVPNYQDLINGLLSILVLAGIINDPTTSARWFLDDSKQSTPSEKDPTE